MAETQDQKVSVLAKLPAAPGKRAELAAAFQAAIDNAQGESGTIYYILHEDAKDADALWVYEMYTEQAALDAHSSSDAFKALGAVLGPFMGGRPELTFLKPLSGKGF
jgi:quinol monooxygenase YgiN